ncbi:multiple inositol polyphosphate phosphatase 1-like isoform X2 [Uloborus diversus]|uniref:multiple inositol polyphosphate phosphatase 1-like isoform X2 n=1 Tax=Uloborus diversus TaxID=327109 RepID=UPI0024092811|nr:multiple inositol polyphosphate phosphatase 1-like isoform X2 [Uloborus diversus]
MHLQLRWRKLKNKAYIVICVALVVLLLNLESIKSSHGDCVQLDGEERCHSTDSNPFRYYGTKTAYHIALQNGTNYDQDTQNCEAKVFYLLSRHATRYPDADNMKVMNDALLKLKEKIINSSYTDKVKMCQNDLERLKMWTISFRLEDDNKISSTGEEEAIELARNFKKRFPAIFNQDYTPEKFVFEYTSRERTRSTAEYFAKGLFDEGYKDIDFEEKLNDEVLQFHKKCQRMQKDCKDKSLNVLEIIEFDHGPLMMKLTKSISDKVGFELTMDEVLTMYKACFFTYALDMDDAWCSLFSPDELKVLEYAGDIDDYYKDAYGNEINPKQACPVADYVVDLFREYENVSNSKAVMQFSHAGGVKKVFSLFGLFKDEKPLKADDFCSQQQRKWRSSLVAPFNANLALILFQCGIELKIKGFHNEKPVILGGCETELCALEDFYKTYSPIAEECDLRKLCCKCCMPS